MPAEEELESHDAHAPQVSLQIIPASFEDLWRQAAHRAARHGHPPRFSRHAKVGKHQASIRLTEGLREQKVARLHIPMANAFGMQVRDALKHMLHQTQSGRYSAADSWRARSRRSATERTNVAQLQRCT
jgi:hypothetical protein